MKSAAKLKTKKATPPANDPLVALRAIASMARALTDGHPRVELGVSEVALDALRAAGATPRAYVYEPGRLRDGWAAVDSLSIEIDGVTFAAQSPARAATSDEIAIEQAKAGSR